MENEEFEVALGEFDEALKHLKNVTGILPSDRRWAEVHFKRCYALQYMNRNAEALGAVKDAMEVLELRKSSLNLEKDALEVADVNAVLEDLKEKVEELEVAVKEEQAMKESMKSMLEQMKSAGGGGAGAEGGGQAAKGGATTPVKDLGVVGRGTKRINLAPVAVGEQENQVMEKKSRSFPVNIEKAPAAEPANEREQLPTENGSGTAPMPAFLKALADKETKTDQNGQAP